MSALSSSTWSRTSCSVAMNTVQIQGSPQEFVHRVNNDESFMGGIRQPCLVEPGVTLTTTTLPKWLQKTDPGTSSGGS